MRKIRLVLWRYAGRHIARRSCGPWLCCLVTRRRVVGLEGRRSVSWAVGELVDLERCHQREVQRAEDMLDVGVDRVEILEDGIFESAAPMLTQLYQYIHL